MDDSRQMPVDAEHAYTILIVEDSPTQAELLRYVLEGQGYHVVAAPDGAQALAAARESRPLLVISDVEMPVMDGYQMCHALKQDPQLSDIPVILLTSLTDPADVLRGLEAGADYYLTKPYDEHYLLGQVQTILAQPVTHVRSPEAEAAAAKRGTPPPLEVVSDGKRHAVTAGRRQILNLLLSTYGNAVQRNQELIAAERQLQDQNKRLQEAAESQRAAHDALKEAQAHMVQTEKLAGLGQMVAGVAHEINNPLAFVSNNMAVLQRDLEGIQRLVGLYRQTDPLLANAGNAAEGAGVVDAPGAPAELLGQIQELCENIDLDYTLGNLTEVLSRSREGLKRIQQIVSDLRDFARLDESDLSDVDVNAGVRSTVHIIGNKARERGIQIETELGELPTLTCYPAKINQLVMNLISNAIDASKEDGAVTVHTGVVDGQIHIAVADKGVGIDPAIRGKIFDPFFTTKPQGQGTGLGLSISYGIARDHGGTIDVDSTVGQGSTFTVRLPIRQRST